MAIPQPTTAPVAHLVPIKDIKPAPWNPKSRISERRLTDLRISVDDLGEMFYPVLVDKDKNLIDGHRRLAVAKSFGWKHIAAITVGGAGHGFDHSFGSVQITQQKLTGNDVIGVYLTEPKALIGKQRERVARIVKKLGKWAVKMLYEAGMSDTVLRTAERTQRYLADAGFAYDLEAVFRWIVKHSMSVTHILIKGGLPAKTIAAAIKNDKPIVLE